MAKAPIVSGPAAVGRIRAIAGTGKISKGTEG
jgi:hypothetical protein